MVTVADGRRAQSRKANTQRHQVANRAKQFMPFAALKGYYDLIQARQRIVQPRHELTDEERLRVSEKLAQVKRRTMIKVTHYDTDAYVTTTGMVADIDFAGRTIAIVKRHIAFDDILDVEGEGIVDRWAD